MRRAWYKQATAHIHQLLLLVQARVLKPETETMSNGRNRGTKAEDTDTP